MKTFGKILIFLGFLLLGASSSNFLGYRKNNSYRFSARKLPVDWCALTCGHEHVKNIVCEMDGKCEAQGECKFHNIDRTQILNAHNKLRNRFAAGDTSQASSIQVANLNALQWDDELAFTARCNLAKCAGVLRHDPCHTTSKFPGHTGQNLWTFSVSTKDGDCGHESIRAIQEWYDEISFADERTLRSYGRSYQLDSKLGHFTQLMWAATTHVGCALTKNVGDGRTQCMMACNYGPGGNVLGARMFTEGQPCSECGHDLHCGETYDALCCESRTRSNDAEVLHVSVFVCSIVPSIYALFVEL